jgi:hypothetical protein
MKVQAASHLDFTKNLSAGIADTFFSSWLAALRFTSSKKYPRCPP